MTLGGLISSKGFKSFPIKFVLEARVLFSEQTKYSWRYGFNFTVIVGLASFFMRQK